MTRRWHLVLTRPRQERQALVQLQRQGYETWLPLAQEHAAGRRGQRQERTVPLFPRYLFVNVDSAAENTAPIRSTIGCCGLVRFGADLATLPGQAIEAIRARCDGGGRVVLEQDWKPGEPLKVAAGPFSGFEAVFQARTGSERVAVLLHWLGVPRMVQMPASNLVPSGA
ncbi:transcription termination/antitermination NusG family protein [Stenotrophomonas sp. MMGLT7]|uniref:transcription termination/antitermination NusG family protein n=1 Tax=Stenotrophomonas sp. MMGLT7 TaxID=2901227 RepID=UPI001E5759DB|nr:hypothetical protein [Stenotrophomonas sp. MMGLT7]